jgi:uncharacterized protein (DUF362 family)
MNPSVTLTKCNDYKKEIIASCLEKHFQFQGGIGKLIKTGDKVLLKPNFIAPRPQQNATQTDPAVIIETARLLKDFGAKPFVGDSPAWGNVFTSVKALQLEEPLKKLDVPIKQLNKPQKYIIGASNTSVAISSVAIEADAIINLPKFKSHQQLVATFAVKNMFGCISGKKKALMHFKKGKNPHDFCELLIDIYEFLHPVLTIIDAVTIMDGPGPIRGRARSLGWLISGTDPIAIETVCARLVNIEPEEIPVIQAAKRLNFGCTDFDKIKFLGDEFPQNVCTDFEHAVPIPIRFSLPKVCKSICKQLWLAIKDEINKKRHDKL